MIESKISNEAEGSAQPEIAKIAELLGGEKVLQRWLATRLDAHDLISLGIPAPALKSLLSTLNILRYGRQGPLEMVLGMSPRTVQRFKNAGRSKRLSQEQSGRMWKFAEILAKATDVFGSQSDAELWMQQPATGLEGRRPIDLLATPAGAELVETFLGRLEYGVYT